MKHQREKVYFTDKYFCRAIFPAVKIVKLKNKPQCQEYIELFRYLLKNYIFRPQGISKQIRDKTSSKEKGKRKPR